MQQRSLFHYAVGTDAWVIRASFDYANKHRRFIDVSPPVLHTDQNLVYDLVSLNTRYVRTQRARCYVLFTLDPLTNAYFRVISHKSARSVPAHTRLFSNLRERAMRTVYERQKEAETSRSYAYFIPSPFKRILY